MNKEQIALHEIGHFVALYSVGLYDEFISMTVGNKLYNGKAVYGLTERSGKSLSELSCELAAISKRLCIDSNAMDDFLQLKEKARKVCLPHIVFFFGGGAIDNKNDCYDEGRNIIDMDIMKRQVLPSMFVNDISDDALAELQGVVFGYLNNVFDAHKQLIDVLKDELLKMNTIDKCQMDVIISKWEANNPMLCNRVNGLYGALEDVFDNLLR